MTRMFLEFFKTEKASGLTLIACTALSLGIAHSGASAEYFAFWRLPVLGYDLTTWINDGLMAVFFLLVGLEIEREIYVGELSRPRKAALPIAAAAGGMAVPALIHFAFNSGTPTQAGVGIPMATDIAFALGVLSLVGNGVPASLKVFLTALAIIDDLGAIVMIALFYTASISALYLGLAAAVVLVLFACNRLNVRSLWVYLPGGLLLWHFAHLSGVHATIAGVILAFLIPFRGGEKESPSARLQHSLHYPVAFIILPMFALANTAVRISGGFIEGLLTPNSLGIILGLVAGKPLGILLFSLAGAKAGMLSLPEGIRWREIAAASILGGVGFTMSIFITLLAIGDPAVIQEAKAAVLAASLVAGTAGFFALRGVTTPGATS
jgi:Na+:H+ antiporter, NhaA family